MKVFFIFALLIAAAISQPLDLSEITCNAASASCLTCLAIGTCSYCPTNGATTKCTTAATCSGGFQIECGTGVPDIPPVDIPAINVPGLDIPSIAPNLPPIGEGPDLFPPVDIPAFFNQIGDLSDGIRLVSCANTAGTLVLSSASVGGGNGVGALTFTVDSNGNRHGTRIQLNYAGITGSGVEAFASHTIFDRLVEFTDTGAPGYDENDAVIAEHNLDFQINETNCNTVSASQYNFKFTSPLSSGGTVDVTCYVVSQKTTIGSVETSPNQVKCDININGYTYINATNKLALRTRFLYFSAQISSNGLEACAASSHLEVCIGSSNDKMALYFDWVKTASVTGSVTATANVLSSKVAISGDISNYGAGLLGHDFWFTFDQAGAENIFWDPQAGVQSTAALSGNTGSASVLIFNSFLFIASLIIATLM